MKHEIQLHANQRLAQSPVDGTLTVCVLDSNSYWWYRTGCNQPNQKTCPYYDDKTTVCSASETPALLSVKEKGRQVICGTQSTIYCAKGESFN